MPEISVIVPVYNAQQYLAECIRSILSQSFQEFELILVDDGSTDGSYAVCETFTDPRIRLLRQENQGQAAARNHAMQIAQGTWIAFIDSDDVVHPKFLELLYRAAEASGAGISACRYVEGEKIPEDFFAPGTGAFAKRTMDEKTLVQLYDEEQYPAWVACTKLVRRELIEGYPFTEGRVYEDNEAVCRWVCGCGIYADLPETLYFYRKNPQSTTKAAFSPKRLDYLWALESITGFYRQLGWEEMVSRFARRYAQAAEDTCYGLREELKAPALAKVTGRRAIRFRKALGLPLNRREKGKMLDASDPALAKLYWPVSGILRRLKGE